MVKWDSWRGCGVTLDGSEVGDAAHVSPSPEATGFRLTPRNSRAYCGHMRSVDGR